MTNLEQLNEIPNKYYWFTIDNRGPTDESFIKILVKALSAKIAYGKTKVLITPILGINMMWVNFNKLELEPNPSDKVYNSLSIFNRIGDIK